MFLTAVGWEVGKGKQKIVQPVCWRQKVVGRKLDQVQTYVFNTVPEVPLKPINNVDTDSYDPI